MNSLRIPALALVVSLSALLLAGCGLVSDDIDGSGTTVVERYDLDDFDRISVSGAFDVEVAVGEASAVSVTVDDNLVDKIDVRVTDGELQLGTQNGVSIGKATLRGTVQLPTLLGLEVSGASSVVVENASGPRHSFDLSGASDVLVDGEIGDLTADIAGSSLLTVRGTAETLTLDASGSSDAKIEVDGLTTASIDASGSSDVSLLSVDTVTGDLSGASTLTAPRAARITVDTSGASSIERS